MKLRVRGSLLVVCLALGRPAVAQSLTERGFVDLRGTYFPQDAANDDTNLVGDLLARGELFLQAASWLQLAAGVDIRANSNDQVSSSWEPDLSDRGVQRPALSIRRLSATVHTHGLTIDGGRQFIRWGKTDILTPTDRFAPRDYLNVIDTELLPVIGVRATYQIRDEAFEVAWVPVFTPSRLPLLNQRWTVTPRPDVPLQYADDPPLPKGSQAGVRWSHTGGGYEYALSFFDGFNTLPNIDAVPDASQFSVDIARRYPSIRTYGGDVAIPTTWFTGKGEAAYFSSSTPGADEYVLYVVQLERQTGEWLLTGGYAGEVVTKEGGDASFAPDRGIAQSIMGRASYTIDPNRSAAVETVVGQTGEGVYLKGEYSWAHGQHWRTTITGALIAGDATDFIGQYQQNDNMTLTFRYSF